MHVEAERERVLKCSLDRWCLCAWIAGAERGNRNERQSGAIGMVQRLQVGRWCWEVWRGETIKGREPIHRL